jgi:hypothetical protein
LENSNRYQIEHLVHISNTIIIIALFTKSLETMTSMYSSKINDDDSHDKTTTSRVRYSRNNSSNNDNLHADRYKQGKRQPDVALRGDERQERMRAEKRIRDLADDVKELEAVNKRLKEELKNYKKKVHRSSKGDIRDSNGWMGDEAILADKVTKFSRDDMSPPYKFLKEGWQDYVPTNKKSLSYFVGRKMADTYRSMRIPTIGREFEDQWESVYVPVIGLKYQNMRCNLGNNVQAQYFGELQD